MNRLVLTQSGGMPLHLDDLKFMDDAYRDAFKAIFSSLSDGSISGSFIISGCEITSDAEVTKYIIAEGWIFYNGEIMKVDAHETLFQAGSGKYIWKEDISYDPNGNDLFEDGNSYDTYQVRKAKVVYEDPPPAEYFEVVAGINGSHPDLNEIIANRTAPYLNRQFEEWKYVSYVNSWDDAKNLFSSESWMTLQAPLRYRKDPFHVVHLQGVIGAVDTAANDQIITTLPQAYWPTGQFMYHTYAYTINLNEVRVLIEIDLSGNVRTRYTASLPVTCFIPINITFPTFPS